MSRIAACALLLSPIATQIACEGTALDFVLVFPSEETFLVSANAVVTIYDGTDDSGTICRQLNFNQAPGITPMTTTGERSVCDFRGSVVLENISEGRVVLYAEVEDQNGTALMNGCRVADVFNEADAIDITLATLPTYPVSPEAACTSIDDKCDASSSCEAGESQ